MSRAVMQQALEALEKGETKLRWAAISALKQALAEPECMCREPWALERVHREKSPCFDYVERKPLTDEEILAEMPVAEHRPIISFARAIERAHGIGEQT